MLNQLTTVDLWTALNKYSSCMLMFVQFSVFERWKVLCSLCFCGGKRCVLCFCTVESIMFCVFVWWKVLCSVCLYGGNYYVLCVCTVDSIMFCVFVQWKVLCSVCLYSGKYYVLCVCTVESVVFRVPRSSRLLAPVLGDTKQSKWGQETAVHWRLSLICCQSFPGLAVSNMPTP